MGESLKAIGAITLFVDDPQRSKEFYARVFEADVVHEDDNSVAFRFDNLVMNLSSAARRSTSCSVPSSRSRRARRF